MNICSTGALANYVKDREAAHFRGLAAAIATFSTVTVTIAAMAGSKSPTLLTSIMVKHHDEEVEVLVRIAVAAFHLITNGFHMFAFWLTCSSVASFSYDLTSMLENMTPGLCCIDGLRYNVRMNRRARQFTRDYRSLAVLRAHFAGLFRHYVSFNQLSATLGVVIHTYQAVVTGSLRSLIISLVVFYGHILYLNVSAEVHDASANALLQWRRVGKGHVPLWFPRFLKSCKNVSVPMGNFFYIDRGLVLTYMSVVAHNSASLILAT